ncbi:MAG: hypothetical protein R6X12_05750 [bacterium]
MKPGACLLVTAVLLLAGWTTANAEWTEVTSMPVSPSGKDVKHGGWLVYNDTNGLVYAAKGNKTPDFYSYDPGADAWTALAAIPLGTEGRPPRRGCRGAWDAGNYLYVTKGNNTSEFWRYDIAENSWFQLPDARLGTGNKKLKGGTDLAYVEIDGDGYVYLLKGFGLEFGRFNVTGDSWERLADAPSGQKPKWDEGSWLVFDGEGTIYAHKAKHSELWTYDIATGAWATAVRAGMPRPSALTGKKKKPGEGSGAAWYDGVIYATKGGNTCEFWSYDAATAAWSELETLPQIGSLGRKRTVKHGGDLVSAGEGVFFALKGKKSREFYKYAPPPEPQAVRPDGVTGAGTLRLDLRGAARVTVFDATGRVVATGLEPRLGAGVYLVRVESDGKTSYRRHVVVR